MVTKWKGWAAVVGGFLVHLTLGTLYTAGNIAPYMTSYIRIYSSPSTMRYKDSTWVFGVAAAFQGAAMFIGGLLSKGRLGPRRTVALGCLIVSCGVLLTGLTIRHSYVLALLTYGVMFGTGVGIAYAPCLACAMKWLPEQKGLVNGIVVAGFGGGAFIFDQVQTAYINPENLSPDQPYTEGSSEKYYSKEAAGDLLERVPKCFYILGACYAVLQVIGCLLITEPPEAPICLPDDECALLEADDEENFDSEDQPLTNSRTLQLPQSSQSLHPREVIKQPAFWLLWSIFMVNGQTVVFISTLYKTYGQTFIDDDRYLAILGSIASVFNCLGRIMWGKLMDRTSFRTSMLILCATLIVSMCTLVATPYGGKFMFTVWICVIFLGFSGNFVLLPTATAKSFGQQYVATNYGLVFTSQVASALVGSLLATTLNGLLGWAGMFFLVAGFAFIGMLLTFKFNVKDAYGKQV